MRVNGSGGVGGGGGDSGGDSGGGWQLCLIERTTLHALFG